MDVHDHPRPAVAVAPVAKPDDVHAGVDVAASGNGHVEDADSLRKEIRHLKDRLELQRG